MNTGAKIIQKIDRYCSADYLCNKIDGTTVGHRASLIRTGGMLHPLAMSYSACFSGNKDSQIRYSHHPTLCAQFPSDGPKAIRWVAENFIPA